MDHLLPDLQEATITELQDGLSKGLFTSLDLVKVYQQAAVSCKAKLIARALFTSGVHSSNRGSQSSPESCD